MIYLKGICIGFAALLLSIMLTSCRNYTKDKVICNEAFGKFLLGDFENVDSPCGKYYIQILKQASQFALPGQGGDVPCIVMLIRKKDSALLEITRLEHYYLLRDISWTNDSCVIFDSQKYIWELK